MIRLKRVYESPSEDDGTRVLVERLWPRGVSKPAAKLDLWLKEVSPSPALRTWYGHRPERWEEFQRRYVEELAGAPEAVALLRRLARGGTVTFVYAAKDEHRNSAAVLKAFLARRGR